MAAPDDELRGTLNSLELAHQTVERLDAEVARLRSEVAALRDAGNVLADAAAEARKSQILTYQTDVQRSQALKRAADAWRSAAGTPTETESS